MAVQDKQSPTLITCSQCGLESTVPDLEPRQKAYCSRCNHVLTSLKSEWVDKILALSLSALAALLLALMFRFLTFSTNGLETTISLLGVIETLVEQDYLGLAGVILFVCVAFPAGVLLMLIIWMVAIKGGVGVRAARAQIILCFNFLKWSMPEVFLVGVLVSMVKILTMAEIEFGPSFYFYICFIVLFIVSLAHLDRHQVEKVLLDELPMQKKPLNRNFRIQWTWALLLTSILLYLPANVLPIMTTRFLGADTPSTIVGGVVTLWGSGSHMIAAIIFIASIFVPVFKIISISYLNYSVQFNTGYSIKHRYTLYRITEFMGRWSMIDVFVVAILVGLVQLGSTMSVYPGPAVVAFCSVVILTMLAAMSFDSKMIWESES